MKSPDRIYLVDPDIDEEEDAGPGMAPDIEGVYWCEDRVHKSDVEYIRADLAAQPPQDEPAKLKGRAAIVEAWNNLPPEIRQNPRSPELDALYAAIRACDDAQPPHFDVEQMLRDTVPGGSSCDPQQIADGIRAWFAARSPRACSLGTAGCVVVHEEPELEACISSPVADRSAEAIVHAAHEEVDSWEQVPQYFHGAMKRKLEKALRAAMEPCSSTVAVKEALQLAVRAMRAPFDGWKGELEAQALAACNALLAAMGTPRPKAEQGSSNG